MRMLSALDAELIAAAFANAKAQAELTASRARIAATADESRRRIERDLHDGGQQRLVSLALQLRVAQAAVPTGLLGRYPTRGPRRTDPKGARTARPAATHVAPGAGRQRATASEAVI